MWNEQKLNAIDNDLIPFYFMKAKGIPIASIHIIHGMSEHAMRYQNTASWLAKHGFNVSAHDLRGHGKRASSPSELGHIGEDGWRLCLEDIKTVYKNLERYNYPIIFIGHSLGSIMLQDYLSSNYPHPSAAILSGTTGPTGFIATLGKLVCAIESWRLGKKSPSPIIQLISFKRYNKHFKNPLSDSDWLSRDKDQVKAYLDDPLCGFECSVGTWSYILNCLSNLHKARKINSIPKSCRILLISGDDDPVGNYGKSVLALKKLYKKAELSVDSCIYKGGRHEMFNETNREQVLLDCYKWLEYIL